MNKSEKFWDKLSKNYDKPDEIIKVNKFIETSTEANAQDEKTSTTKIIYLRINQLNQPTA